MKSASGTLAQWQTVATHSLKLRQQRTGGIFSSLFNRCFLGMTLVVLFSGVAFRITAAVIHVSASQTNNVPDGETWPTAFNQVQQALNAASHGDAVWIAAGTYFENVAITNGVMLYGGFAGDETDLSQRNWTNHFTILDGRRTNTVVTIAGGAMTTTRVDGFVIRNGYSRYGGGIYCSNASATIVNNMILQNQATKGGGGGIACYNSSAVIVFNLIQENMTDNSGGGIYSSASTVTIQNNRIIGNSAIFWGGGVAYYDTLGGHTSQISGNLVLGNFGILYGGGGSGLSLIGSGAIAVCNNTIVWNQETTVGSITQGAILCDMTNALIANNIVAFGTTGIDGVPGMAVSNNCVFGNYSYNYRDFPDPTGSNGNISVDPQLASNPFSPLLPTSPCINAGNNSCVRDGTDLYGNPRIVDGTVDIGAVEFNGSTPVFLPDILRVSPDGNNGNDGSSWDKAKRTIQSAIDQPTWNAKEVWVGGGTYGENVFLRHFVTLYGGFLGNESNRDQRDWNANTTIIDGRQNGSVITVTNLLQWNVIDGFTIRNGNAFGGSGINCNDSAPVIANNTITGNNGVSNHLGNYSWGGGISISSDSSWFETLVTTITNNLICSNSAAGGAGIFFGGVPGTSAWIADNRLEYNVGVLPSSIGSWKGGGGIYIDNGKATILNNFFLGNIANSPGGAIYAQTRYGSTVGQAIPFLISGNTLLGNSASGPVLGSQGGGIYSSGFSIMIANNLIAFGNSGIYSYFTTNIWNNCVFGNGTNYPLSDLTGTNGNISVDPLLAAPNDYHLSPDSPCINAGNNAFVFTGTDIDGNPRIAGGTVDIGAYEFPSPTSVISYAWLQQYGLSTDGSADYADTDGDGMNNWQEWRAGTDPTNGLSMLRMVTVSNSVPGLTVSWQSVGGVTYLLQRSSDLTAQPTFSTLVTNLVGQTGTTSFTDTNAPGSGPFFYRVGVQ
jgi:hypothetical protein